MTLQAAPHTATETEPLLSVSPTLHASGAKGLNPFPPNSTKALIQEFKILVRYAIPLGLASVLRVSQWVITVASVGHIGTKELTASALGNITFNITSITLIIGMAEGLDTLCTQAATSQPFMTPIHAARTGIILMLMMIPCSILNYNVEAIFLMLHQDPEVAALSSLYLRILNFQLPAFIIFEVFRRYINSQGKMLVPTIVIGSSVPLQLFFNWLFVWGPDRFRIGYAGAPLAVVISLNFSALISVMYCVTARPPFVEKMWTRQIFVGWSDNLKLGLAGVGALATELVSWECIALASTYLGPKTLAAQSIIISFTSGLFLPLVISTSTASAVRIGNLLGADMHKLARTTTRATFLLGFLLGAINFTILIGLAKRIAFAFSTDVEVVELAVSILPLTAISQIGNASAGVSCGILRGAGGPRAAAIINAMSYCFVGLPLSFFLAFQLDYGFKGLWSGLIVSPALSAMAMSWYIQSLDYTSICQDIKVRNKRNQQQDVEVERSRCERLEQNDEEVV